MAARLTLDVCTPDGKTWLAQLTGLSQKFGFDRVFVNASSSNLSKSGMTGSKTYLLIEDGIYQSREARRSLRHSDDRDGQGNRFYRVAGDVVTVIDQDEAIAALSTSGAE